GGPHPAFISRARENSWGDVPWEGRWKLCICPLGNTPSVPGPACVVTEAPTPPSTRDAPATAPAPAPVAAPDTRTGRRARRRRPECARVTACRPAVHRRRPVPPRPAHWHG